MNRFSPSFIPLRLLGLMSGTSLDGLDLALCSFWQTNRLFRYQIIQTKTYAYPKELSTKLRNLYISTAQIFVETEVAYSNFMAQCVNHFLVNVETKTNYIASHGHTVFHRPEMGITKQIGNGAILAAKTGIATICDFRTTDVALGGQGAPLVPIGDEMLFPEYAGCLNLGGIANISYRKQKKRIAYDISLCNILLNYLAARLGLEYDDEGAMARNGRLNKDLLMELNQPEYFAKNGAKSIGYELFDTQFKPLLDRFSISIEDKLRTVCEHIATQIAKNLKGLKTVLTTGGGAKNSFLIQLIKKKSDTQIIIPDEQLVDFKEALVFAFLGYLRIHETNNTLSSVTGATRNSVGGALYLA